MRILSAACLLAGLAGCAAPAPPAAGFAGTPGFAYRIADWDDIPVATAKADAYCSRRQAGEARLAGDSQAGDWVLRFTCEMPPRHLAAGG